MEVKKEDKKLVKYINMKSHIDKDRDSFIIYKYGD